MAQLNSTNILGNLSITGNSCIGGTSTIHGAFIANGSSTFKGSIIGETTLTVAGVGQVGNIFTIKNASGGNAALIFDRASNANWQVLSANGDLFFQCDYTNTKSSYYNVLKLGYNTKQATFFGNVLPNGNATLTLGGSSNKWKTLYVGNDTDATSTSTGVIQAAGGIAATKSGYFGGNLTVNGTAAIAKDTTIGNGTDSTSMTTGALKVTGGVGISEQLNAKTVRIDNSVYFQYNSSDKSLDVIFG